MSKKSQPSPPPAPNPLQIAQTEATVNRINQSTPFGSLTYSGPYNNNATLSLSPEMQQLYQSQIGNSLGLNNLAQSAMPGIQNLISNPLTTAGLPALPQYDPYRAQSERAFFDRSANLLNEQFGKQEDQLRQTLANQGLQTGSNAYGTELGLFNQRRNEQFGNLANDAVLFGGQEASRQLQDQAAIRAQLLGEQQSLRGNQFGELASLLGINQQNQTQIPGLQNFFAPSQVGVGDAFALNQAAEQNSFNQRSASARATKGEFSDLLSTLISSWSPGGAMKKP